MVRRAPLIGRTGTAGGIAAALLAATICAAYPVATRAALQSTATPADLLLLRFAAGLVFLAPFAWIARREFTRSALLSGLPLAAFQGVGMAALVILGLQHAPAAHAAALGPGTTPLWVALLGALLFARRIDGRHAMACAVVLAGVVLLVATGGSHVSPVVLTGDAMFLGAAVLGSLYLLQLRASGLSPQAGATLVAAYTTILVVPWYLASGAGNLARMPWPELGWHVGWQGLLIGCVSLVATNHAVARLGSSRASAAFATTPAVAAVLGMAFLGETPSIAEGCGVAAISLGALLGTTRHARPAPVPA